ncbi:hypothetical protein BpHYR1_010278 [Brachionus plicatilis]|uniref:Uncharacterized protein n=1 Tax=Brachionus plicatilis TaxID=10195 RepID=A0A3M7P8Y9_BRAPC|nr:hypothetical protein BpHYR1_010278 [Brachionus plicatilis]
MRNALNFCTIIFSDRSSHLILIFYWKTSCAPGLLTLNYNAFFISSTIKIENFFILILYLKRYNEKQNKF